MTEISIIKNGRSEAALWIGEEAPSFYRWVAEEIRKYIRRLSGVELPLLSTGYEKRLEKNLLLVGGPRANPLTKAALGGEGGDFSDFREDEFILKSVFMNNKRALVLAGGDERATMYAAYELLERLGVVFQITGDIIPEPKGDLILPEIDLRRKPAIKRRGFHLRHFVMPWMGLDYFKGLIDQMAKLKCNYLEFFWYVGSPWVEYSYRGTPQLIGDIHTRDSGYASWRLVTGGFIPANVEIGRDHFAQERICAPEFQTCNTPEEAYEAARELLRKMIDYSHERKIEIWLGMGDCPSLPPNLARFSRRGEGKSYLGAVLVPPTDPIGIEVWSTALNQMIETYPKADGYWLWLLESYLRGNDLELKELLAPYGHIRSLIPGLDKIREMGYDQYVDRLQEEELMDGDLLLTHYGKGVMENIRKEHPEVRLGVSVLGRSYLFPALDAALPKNVALQSMEASICWNRNATVPMENFGLVKGRDTWLVPRLDDDASGFAMQFNVGLYDHDRVLEGSAEYAVRGIAPQVGKTRGLEQNASYIAEGCWNTALKPNAFYERYVGRIFGIKALDPLTAAYRALEENEMFLGLEVKAGELGRLYFLGLDNFTNWCDPTDIRNLRKFARQSNPFGGPDFPEWNARERAPSRYLKAVAYRLNRFKKGLGKLRTALDCLARGRPTVLPGARNELEYVICKTESYILHLQTLCALYEGFLEYDAAFRTLYFGKEEAIMPHFEACEKWFSSASVLSEKTARKVASRIDDPTELHILFRYNVRIVLPLREFRKFIGNVVNFHRGKPYWERVEWEIIAPLPPGRGPGAKYF